MLPCQAVLTHSSSGGIFYDAFGSCVETRSDRASLFDYHVRVEKIVRLPHSSHSVVNRNCSGILYYAVSVCTDTTLLFG